MPLDNCYPLAREYEYYDRNTHQDKMELFRISTWGNILPFGILQETFRSAWSDFYDTAAPDFDRDGMVTWMHAHYTGRVERGRYALKCREVPLTIESVRRGLIKERNGK